MVEFAGEPNNLNVELRMAKPAELRENLPDWVCKDPELSVELFSSVLYRNKGAYLVGRIYTADEQWPLAIPLLHLEAVSYTHLTLPTNREV